LTSVFGHLDVNEQVVKPTLKERRPVFLWFFYGRKLVKEFVIYPNITEVTSWTHNDQG